MREKSIDPDRIFVTGLSAGGAMTSVMLACYPETFAAGAIIAGLPYGAASNVQQAFQSMFQCPSRPAEDWGDLVRAAAPRHGGPWLVYRSGTAMPTRLSSLQTRARSSNNRSNVTWTVGRAFEGTEGRRLFRQVWLNDAGDELVEILHHHAYGTWNASGDGGR